MCDLKNKNCMSLSEVVIADIILVAPATIPEPSILSNHLHSKSLFYLVLKGGCKAANW